MSCEIANGRLEVCKDAMGGLDAIYVINYDDFAHENASVGGDITFDDINKDVVTVISNVANVYKFELRGANSFDQAVQNSADAGTSFVQQDLVIQLKKQDVTTNKTFKLLAYGRPTVIVRNRNNQFFVAGLFRGMDMTAGGTKNGTQMGDFNGYEITLQGKEYTLANFLDCTNEADLIETVLDGATLHTA